MDDKRISMKWKYNLGLVCDTIQSILSVQRMLVSMQTSEFLMDRREQNGVGIFVFDGMVKGV